MPERPFAIYPARDDDRRPLASLFAAVAEERDGIAAEPPIDVARRAAAFDLDATIGLTLIFTTSQSDPPSNVQG